MYKRIFLKLILKIFIPVFTFKPNILGKFSADNQENFQMN